MTELRCRLPLVTESSCTADGIRVSDVSIVADGPISGLSQECKDCGKSWTCKKKPPEIHALCKSCSSQQQPMPDSSEVGEELSDQSGAGSPQPCPVEIVARSRTATPRVEHVSIVADDPISGNPDNVKQWCEEIQLCTMLTRWVE